MIKLENYLQNKNLNSEMLSILSVVLETMQPLYLY